MWCGAADTVCIWTAAPVEPGLKQGPAAEGRTPTAPAAAHADPSTETERERRMNKERWSAGRDVRWSCTDCVQEAAGLAHLCSLIGQLRLQAVVLVQ